MATSVRLTPAVTSFSGSASAWEISRRSKGSLWCGSSRATPSACAALTGRFLSERPAVAQRFAQAWAQACALVMSDPASVRPLLVQHMQTYAELAPTIPLVNFRMVKDMTAEEIADFQKFVDLAVAQGVVRDRIEVRSFLRAL